jgi:hypothetical protein
MRAMILYALKRPRLTGLKGVAKTGEMESAKRIKATADQRMMFREVGYEFERETLLVYVMGGEVRLILRDDTWARPYLRIYLVWRCHACSIH